MFMRANGSKAVYNSINIEETLLNGVTNLEKGQKERFKWRGSDDDKIPDIIFPNDKENFVVALPP